MAQHHANENQCDVLGRAGLVNERAPLLDSYVCTIQNELHRENKSERRGPGSGLFGDCPHGQWWVGHGRMAPGGVVLGVMPGHGEGTR